MFQLAAFADEISGDVQEQARVCGQLSVRGIEFRSAGGVNVLDMDEQACREAVRMFADHGAAIVCIGSPIGKVAIDKPFADHLARFRLAVERAHWFDARFIRVFSFYPDAAGHLPASEVLARFEQMTAIARSENIVLLHENEKDIFGAGAENGRALLARIDSPHLRAAFDFANFVQVRQDTLRAWEMLRDYTAHIHIKDAVWETGTVVPAGKGDGHIGEILRDAASRGYDGFLSLEPHLAAAGQFSGFSGPALFEVAVKALREVLAREHLREG